MLRKIRETLIRTLSESDTIYVGKGVYHWVNQNDKLVIRSDQRIVPCDSIWTQIKKERFLLTTLMERDWDETSKWYYRKDQEPGTYTHIKDGWKQWKRWLTKNRNHFLPVLEIKMNEADIMPSVEDLLQIREIKKSV